MTSEEIVKSHFVSLGYIVAIGDNENQNGFDVVAVKDNEYLIIEVKTASRITGKNCWRVREVSEYAKNSDVIAIVLPSKKIHFENMKHHLLSCSISGDRYITEIVKCNGYGGGDENE
jgi:Holliday junction resolvase